MPKSPVSAAAFISALCIALAVVAACTRSQPAARSAQDQAIIDRNLAAIEEAKKKTIAANAEAVRQRQAKDAIQSSIDARQEVTFQRAVLGAEQLRASMRDPDSFQLAQALVMNDGTVCYGFRARNGFGGMNPGHAVLAPSGQFKSDEMDGFHSLWKQRCANKTGADKTWEVGYAAGFHGIFSEK